MKRSLLSVLFLIGILNFSIAQTGVKAARKVYAVLIGIDDYQNNQYLSDLNYTDDDAENMNVFLTDRQYGNVPEANITKLIGSAASKEQIITAMRNQFAKATANDLVIFFYSGHGGVGLICPWDYSPETKLSYTELKAELNRSRAAVKLCFIDACHAGSFSDRGVTTTATNTTGANRDIAMVMDTTAFKKSVNGISSSVGTKAATGQLFVFAACRKDETSQEQGALQGGVFAYHLLKALKGEADYNHNKRITVGELNQYLAGNIGNSNPNQSPVTLGTRIGLNTIVMGVR
ncbi:hypothetical protein BH09BAC2_BH09BAC2_12520 [soil metagenome]